MGYSPRGGKESDRTERLHFHRPGGLIIQYHCIFLAFYTAHVVLKPKMLTLLPFHPPVHHMWSELFRMTGPSLVILHMAHISLSYTKV